MFFRTVRRGARAMLQAPFPVNAARAGDLRAVTAWRQRCATTEANPVDARFPFDEWRPLQLAPVSPAHGMRRRLCSSPSGWSVIAST